MQVNHGIAKKKRKKKQNKGCLLYIEIEGKTSEEILNI